MIWLIRMFCHSLTECGTRRERVMHLKDWSITNQYYLQLAVLYVTACCAMQCVHICHVYLVSMQPYNAIAVLRNVYQQSNCNIINYTLQQMLGVIGTSLISPGWFILGGMVGTGNVSTLKSRHYNVITDLSGVTPYLGPIT